MADHTPSDRDGDEPSTDVELTDDDLATVSGGSGPSISMNIPRVRVNLVPGPNLAIVPDIQSGDPHVE